MLTVSVGVGHVSDDLHGCAFCSASRCGRLLLVLLRARVSAGRVSARPAIPLRRVRLRRRDDRADDRAVHHGAGRGRGVHPKRRERQGRQLRSCGAVLDRADRWRCCCSARSMPARDGTPRPRRCIDALADTVEPSGEQYLHAMPAHTWGGGRRAAADRGVLPACSRSFSLHLRRAAACCESSSGMLLYICGPGAVPHGRERRLLAAGLCPRRGSWRVGWQRVAADARGHADGLVHHQRRARRPYPQPAGGGAQRGRHLGAAPWA